MIWRWLLSGMLLLASGASAGFADDVTLTCTPAVAAAESNDRIAIHCQVANHADHAIGSRTNYFLSYHLETDSGKVLRWDNKRIPFASSLLSGTNASVDFAVPAPARAGDYLVRLDIVHEGVVWLSAKGNRFPTLTLSVTPEKPHRLSGNALNRPVASILDTNDDLLNGLWRKIERTIADDRTSIFMNGRNYATFTAGERYPQVWIRDCASTFDAARWFMRRDALRGCLMLHLRTQDTNGSINDWVGANGTTDKNTVEADQEASLVQLLTKYVDASGDAAFLSERIDGITVLDRAENALAYVWRERLDRKTGLLTSGHTIDWGDVQIGRRDQRAVYLDRGSPLVSGIYTQAMFVIAVNDLIRLFKIGHARAEEVRTWQQRVDAITNAARKQLWNEQGGYFMMHRHVTPLKHAFDEIAMFPMGGNAVAIEAGLATPRMAGRIFSVAAARQRKYGISTISGVLLPPYPAGAYEYPLVSVPYSYQNGGQWDWFGGRLLLDMYKYGYSDLANLKLRQIAQKIDTNGSILEWEHPNGTAGGGEYAGAAGVLARTITEGLFGIDMRGQSLDLTIRLPCGVDKATFAQPATLGGIGVDYACSASTRAARLVIHLQRVKLHNLSVLIPAVHAALHDVRWNDRPVAFSSPRCGQDEFVDIAIPESARAEKMEIRFRY